MMVRRDHLGYILKSFKSGFPPTPEEGKRSRTAVAHTLHSSLLQCFLPFPPNPGGRRFVHPSTLLQKRGGYLLITSILKSNVHLDNHNPVTTSSQNTGRQRLRKKKAKEESHPRLSSPDRAGDEQPILEPVRGSRKDHELGLHVRLTAHDL